jgi:hypothetical protein
LQSDCKANAKAIAKRLQSDYAAYIKRLRSFYKAIAERLRGDCIAIAERLKKLSQSDYKAIAQLL